MHGKPVELVMSFPEISSAKGDVKLTLRFMHAVQGNVLAPAQPLFRLPVLN